MPSERESKQLIKTSQQTLTTQAKTEKHRKYSQHNQKQKALKILTTQPKTEKHRKYSQQPKTESTANTPQKQTEKHRKYSQLGVDRLSAWPIIGADIKHFTDYRYRPFSKHICR